MPTDASTVALVLAAGRGVRMRSQTPKVLHRVGGISMVRRVAEAARRAGAGRVVVVVGPNSPDVRGELPSDVVVAVQPEPRGTGDAVRCGLSEAPGAERILVVGGDTPLVTDGFLRGVVDRVPSAAVALGAATLSDPKGYGRIVRTTTGQVARIVEQAHASADERAIGLVNGMIFAFDGEWLRQEIATLGVSPSGEVYLTDLIEVATRSGRSVDIVESEDPWEIVGVNSLMDLAAAEAALRARTNRRWMQAGVTLIDPSTTFIDESVALAPDVVIEPQCYLRGNTVVEEGCILGPGAEIIDSYVAAGARVSWSVVEGAQIGERVHLGPYCRIRPGTRIGADVALGSFSEIKASEVGARTQMHHFGYLGDAVVGSDVNIGAGTITCNFDGVDKHETVIGAGAFVGSDTMLVAPVTLGQGARTGAGAVVTRDVPDGRLAVGVPARLVADRGGDQPEVEGQSAEEDS